MKLSSFVVVAIALGASVEASSFKKQLPGGKAVKEPSYFTSAFSTRAVNTTIINNDGNAVPGQPGAYGHFGFRINSDKDIVCWDIRTVGVTGEYQSPAVTATHIHQADAGKAGPPRLAFPNPSSVGKDALNAEVRESKGCMQGPFKSGVKANDVDTAQGFRLKQIEENPSNFFADTHTREFSAGAVRGQLLRSEREVKKPRSFTSVIKATAKPENVVNAMNVKVQGIDGAKGHYTFKINTHEDVICYDITLNGFPKNEQYFSPAKTATHTHQAPKDTNGPPRLAYKNPQRKSYLFGLFKGSTRHSSACIKGPFTTGLLANGKDTGSESGFKLSDLEQNVEGFFSDTHTASRQAGAVRGQNFRA